LQNKIDTSVLWGHDGDMDDARLFEEHRDHLRAVAYRMLGSLAEADDAVQETWLRLHRADTSDVVNLGGWLTTVIGRVCLDLLRSRRSRREDPIGDREPVDGDDPERDALLAADVGPALLVVLDTLTPAERLAFVLHDMFAVPFEEIAPIVGRAPAATRQLASRARRRVQGVGPAPDPDLTRQREVVDAFLAASRGGDFAALLVVLDPSVVLRADRVTVAAAQASPGAPALAEEVHGRDAVATAFRGRAQAARLALVDGSVGAVWAEAGTVRAAFLFTVVDHRIVDVRITSDPARLAELEIEFL
jgi:RNA polymerase sigma-70 factor (ECF subfamily)